MDHQDEDDLEGWRLRLRDWNVAHGLLHNPEGVGGWLRAQGRRLDAHDAPPRPAGPDERLLALRVALADDPWFGRAELPDDPLATTLE